MIFDFSLLKENLTYRNLTAVMFLKIYGGRFPSSLFDKSLKYYNNNRYKSIIMK